VLKAVSLARPPKAEEPQEDPDKELKKEWMISFLKKEGFEFVYGLFMKIQAQGELNSFQKNFMGFILKILRIFITAAFMATEPDVANEIELV
jgi:hypothetical protein